MSKGREPKESIIESEVRAQKVRANRPVRRVRPQQVTPVLKALQKPVELVRETCKECGGSGCEWCDKGVVYVERQYTE